MFEKSMLSFELSAIDLILALAVVVLLVLYATKLSSKTPIDELRAQKDRRTQQRTETKECPYLFGYLHDLDDVASIPDECLECSRQLECAGETNILVSIPKAATPSRGTPPTEAAAIHPQNAPTPTPTLSIECPFRFGYLETLSRDVPIPEECVNCPRILECMGEPNGMTSLTKLYTRLSAQ
jgi:hypothetical protein